MRPMKALVRLVAAACCLSIFLSCTANPFGDDDISADRGKIRGTVTLNDTGSPQGVYVWLDGFKVGAWTDAGGKFQLTLPPPSAQGAGGGVSGIFSLYFYIANYSLASAQVVTQNGEFVYSRGDFNSKGELASPRSLRRFLRISTAVSPASVQMNDPNNRIGVTVSLQATIDSATVIFPGSVGGLLGGVLFRKVGTDTVIVHALDPGARTRDVQIVGTMPHQRFLIFTLAQLNPPLTPGEYEVIPYLLMGHEAVPAGLISTIAADAEKLGPNYLKIPFRREAGQLTVTN